MKFEIKKSKDGQFYFNLLARNNKIVATSELYAREENALKTARLIASEKVFEIRDLTRSTPQTLLLDINGNIIRDGDSIYFTDTFWGDTEILKVKYDEETDMLWYIDEDGFLGDALDGYVKLARYEIEIVPEGEST